MSETLYELMKRRRSIRCFEEKPVPRALVQALVEAAVTAPSASNKQPWRFLVVESRERIERMAEAVRRAQESIGAHIVAEYLEAFEGYGRYFVRFEDAPLVIAPIFRKATLLSNLVGDGLPASERGAVETMERDSAMLSASLAVQNMLLMAVELGLGASVMTGPLIAAKGLAEILGLRPSWELLSLVPVGYPAEAPPPTERKDAAKVTRFIED